MGSPKLLFPLFLVVTVLLLAVVVTTGLKRRLRLHIPFVGVTIVSLAVTIYYAERLGEFYDLESAGWIKHVHLALAPVTTLSYLAPIVTGVMTLRNRAHRRLHFRLAMVVLALTLATAVTGAWMVLAATPL